MIVLLPDGKLINLNLVCFTDTRSFKEPVRFCMVNGESVFCEMTEDQYQALLLSLVHNEPLHKVLPIKEKRPVGFRPSTFRRCQSAVFAYGKPKSYRRASSG